MLKKENIPNFVSCLRILGTLLLIPVALFSKQYFYLYIFCGFTDVLDGFLARRLNSTSELGSKLDSFSDILFYLISTIKLFPVAKNILPYFFWIIVLTLIVIRCVCYLINFKKTGELQHTHSILNKLTGFMLFLAPFVIESNFLEYYYIIGLIIASLGTLEDLLIVIRRQENVKE